MPFSAFEGGKFSAFTAYEAFEIGDYFDATAMDMGIYIIIECPRKSGEYGPFLVGGKIAIFMAPGEGLLFGVGPPGEILRPLQPETLRYLTKKHTKTSSAEA